MTLAIVNRREALARLAILLGGALIGEKSYLFGSPISDAAASVDFSDAELVLLDEIGGTIIPATDTPGAKAAKIGGFMAMMVRDCYDDHQQSVFKVGLTEIDAISSARFGAPFLKLEASQRIELLANLDAEQYGYTLRKTQDDPDHYFRMMKQLSILGYFTSEIGCTRALRYEEVPGVFRGDEPYKQGDRAWFVPPSRSI